MKSAIRRRISPSVPFTLTFEDSEGKASFSYRLSYNLNSLTLVEEVLGLSMFTDIGTVVTNPSVKNVSVLLWAALQENHPEYEGVEGLEVVRQNLTIAQLRDTLNACSEAYVKQLPLEQQKNIEARIKGEKEGSEALPLTPSPEAAAL